MAAMRRNQPFVGSRIYQTRHRSCGKLANYSLGCSRSPRRTKNGVANIEIVIRTLASATRSAVINPPTCAAPNRTKPNSPHCASTSDSRTASALVAPRTSANPKTTVDFISRIAATLSRSGAQVRLTIRRSTDSPTLRKNRARRVLFTGSTVAAMRWPNGDIDNVAPRRKVPRAHRQPDALGSERSSEDSEKAQADESGFVFLILGDRKDARQPISPADDNPDH